ncbi:hypothetical protein Syun_025596 [Stephania yunnanensis]|uniref:Uncharacterized protein n=1 Tax=Stephania yunnanensis TaxID=152371 RepID=A0AAP0HVX6_9MAGN
MFLACTDERLFTDSSETPPTVNELYLHLHTVNHDGMTFIDTRSERFYDRLQRTRQELTQATSDQSVDDEACWTQRWIHGVYGVALASPLVIEENGAFPFKTHLTMETEKEMQKFTAKIVDMMKQEKLYASQGGPIIFSQEEGWPSGLQPLNMRVGLVRTRDFSGSISFNTLITGSPSSSTDSSSDLDIEIEEGADGVWSIVGGKVGDLFVNLFHRLQLQHQKPEPVEPQFE